MRHCTSLLTYLTLGLLAPHCKASEAEGRRLGDVTKPTTGYLLNEGVPRKLQSMDYGALPTSVKTFLELYFPDYFPPSDSPQNNTRTTTTTRKAPQPTKQPNPSTSNSTANLNDVPQDTALISDFQIGLFSHQNMYRERAGLKALQWSSELASYISDYMESKDVQDHCQFEHSSSESRKLVGPFRSVGENLYMSWSFKPTPERVIRSWYNEINCYKYGPVGETCTKWRGPKCKMDNLMVGHFTQLMWSTATHVGCAIRQCLSCHGNNCPQYYIGCSYASNTAHYGGNMRGKFPFDRATARRIGLEFCPTERSVEFRQSYDDTTDEDIFVEVVEHENLVD